MATLTPKQQTFIEHYLTCWNASEAARRAGYSEKTAGSQASRLLKDVNIIRAIDARMGELKMSANEALLILTSQARASLDDLVDEYGEVNIQKARNAGKLGLVKKYKVSTRTFKDETTITTEIELHDAQNAAMLIGKHHGAFIDKSAVDMNHSGEMTQHFDLTGLTDEQLKLLASSLKD